MNEREGSLGTAPETAGNRIMQRLVRWLRIRGTNDEYLADASDLAELERRMRILERTSVGPMFRPFD